MPISQKQLISEKNNQDLLSRFGAIRAQSLKLCEPLETEDYVVQPVTDVSPPKWHLAHTTWFFEVFILLPYARKYKLYNKDYPYLFNSYYVSAGDRWNRADRGALTRPTVKEIFAYRAYVEQHMMEFLSEGAPSDEIAHVLEIGLQHEQQHQELLLYDIKYILGHNPIFPFYVDAKNKEIHRQGKLDWLRVEKGNYLIGHEGDGFCFDNEQGRHEVHLHEYEVASKLVTVAEYLEFMRDGGYEDHRYWLSDGWDWLKGQSLKAPMYWLLEDGQWSQYSLHGLQRLNPDEPVAHISFYEADAFARWKGCRLPTEFEWEVAAQQYERQIPEEANFVEREIFKPVGASGYGFYGNLWEWTASSYEPYPFYKAPDGALGEYNGKFMVNQKVLRGGSYATPREHMRLTYRNFFHPHLKWLFNGIRLARHI